MSFCSINSGSVALLVALVALVAPIGTLPTLYRHILTAPYRPSLTILSPANSFHHIQYRLFHLALQIGFIQLQPQSYPASLFRRMSPDCKSDTFHYKCAVGHDILPLVLVSVVKISRGMINCPCSLCKYNLFHTFFTNY